MWQMWQNISCAAPQKYPNHIVFKQGKHDDVIKWKHFPRNWPFVREIHRSPVNFPHKGQWRGALMFSLIYAWINDWVNNHDAGDLRRQHGHYDVIVMVYDVICRRPASNDLAILLCNMIIIWPLLPASVFPLYKYIQNNKCPKSL